MGDTGTAAAHSPWHAGWLRMSQITQRWAMHGQTGLGGCSVLDQGQTLLPVTVVGMLSRLWRVPQAGTAPGHINLCC